MIVGILIAYTALTFPIVAYIVYKVYVRVRGPKVYVNEIPLAPVKNDTQKIVDVIHVEADIIVRWIHTLVASADEARKDHKDMLQATQAIAASMLEIKGIAQDFSKTPSPERSIEQFVHSLEYARDKFAKTQTQKKAVQSIISIIKTSHGTESK